MEGYHSENIGGMWTLKHEISSPRFYELLVKIELKGDTALYIKNFYNNVKMSLDAVTRLREQLIPDFFSIKKNDDFKEYIVPDPNHSSYTWNLQVYNFLGQSLLVAMTNDICLKTSVAPQAYKIVSTRAHENSGWIILSRILNSRAPHLGGMNGDIQSGLATLAFRNGEQLEDFHSSILRLQQEIMLSEEISPLPDFFSST